MHAAKDEMCYKCASKLDQALSKSDPDLRIIVAHSNMLEYLMSAYNLPSDQHHNSEYDDPNTSNTDCDIEPGFRICSGHLNNLSPMTTEVSINEMELLSAEAEESH